MEGEGFTWWKAVVCVAVGARALAMECAVLAYCYWGVARGVGISVVAQCEYRVVHCPDNGWYWCVSRSQRAWWSTGYNTQQPREATPRTKSFIYRFRVRWKEVVPVSAPSDKDRMRLE